MLRRFRIIVPLLIAFCLAVPSPAGASTESQAAADGLGKLLGESGFKIAAGAVPAIEHLFDNWDKIKNPCGCTLKLLRAMLMDARDRGGQNFAFTMLDCFDLPQFGSFTFAQLEQQGEYLSARFNRNRTASLRALRQIINEIRRQCYPRTATAPPPVKPPPVTTGGGTAGTPTPPPTGTTPAPSPEPAPEWSIDNPCPECQSIADALAAEKSRLAQLQTGMGTLNQAAIDNQLEQARIGQRIAALNAQIDSQKGAFAESFDPESGLTIRAENVGGGQVKITTKDADGNVIEERTRKSRSAERNKARIRELEKQLQELKKQEAELRNKIKELGEQIDASQKRINELATALEKCIEEKCKKKIACAEPPADQAIIVGSNADVGSGARRQAKVEETVGGLVGGLLGGGGGGLFGGGGSEDVGGGNEPDTQADPVPDSARQRFTDPATGAVILVGAVPTADGLLFSIYIDDAPGDGTFQTVFLENPRGQRAGPLGYSIFHLYQEWSLTVSWTYDRWVDGQHVEHREGGWDEQGRDFLGTFRVPAEGQGIWRRLGFDNAVMGVRGLGTQFPITTERLQAEPVDLVIHITRPQEDPVTTIPFIINVSANPDGTLHFRQADRTLARRACE